MPTAPTPALSMKKTKSSSRAGRVDTTSRSAGSRPRPPRSPSTTGSRNTSGGIASTTTATSAAGIASAAVVLRGSSAFIATWIAPNASSMPTVKLIWRTAKSRVRWCGSRDSSAPSAACGSV